MTDQQLIAKQLMGLSRLAQVEWDVRQAVSLKALAYVAVNDTHRLIAYDHALLWVARKNKIIAISGGLKVEPGAPQIVWFQHLANHLVQGRQALKSGAIDPETLPRNLKQSYREWIGGQALWMPLTGPHSRLEGGLILLRAKPFAENEIRSLDRLGNAYGSAMTALGAPARKARDVLWRRKLTYGLMSALLLAFAFIRLPLTVLAEARVTASDPVIVAAPLDGVIAQVAIKPNEIVRKGQLLLRFDRTQLHAAKEVALKRVAVLGADSQRSEALAFADPKARAQISILRAKLAEGRAELNYARQRLARVAVHSEAGGVALLDNSNEWVGRPVKVGERIMVIADPKQALLEIQVAVEDALFATPGAQVDFFLATKPSDPISVRLTKVSYGARLQPDQSMRFVAEARFLDGQIAPRLGLTGTAKIYGPRVSLAYMLFRKPMAHLRRLFGI